MHPRTCVITVNYRCASDTAACLESLKFSTVPVKTVVVDNTPNDPALTNAIENFESSKIIRAPENLGFGRGNNLGIDWALLHTDCEFLLILNNDTTIWPDAIEQMEASMDNHPEASIVTGRIVFAENESILWYGGGEINWKRGGAIVPGIMGSANSELAMTPREVGFASGCTMLIRRKVLNIIGGFDPLFFMYEEDVDLSLRARSIGPIYYEPEALVFHKVRGSQRKEGQEFQGRWSSKNPNYVFHTYQMVRSAIINARRHAKGNSRLEFVFFYPAFVLRKVLLAARSIGLESIKPVIRGAISGFKEDISVTNENRDPAGKK